MAIQVNGTQVIGNSRELTNISSVDATTVAAFGAAGVGGSDVPTPPNWLSPSATVSSSGTWSKPGSIGDDDWVVFYAVGGGAGWGEYNSAGGGGSAVIVAMKGSVVPSTVSVTVGDGGGPAAQKDGGDTTFTISGVVITAGGGKACRQSSTIYYPDQGIFSVPSDGTSLAVALGSAATTQGAPGSFNNFPGQDNYSLNDSLFGGAAGGASGFNNASAPGGVSTYAGNGGNGGNLTVQNGSVPGGGAGGTYYGLGDPNTVGGKGNLRIYY